MEKVRAVMMASTDNVATLVQSGQSGQTVTVQAYDGTHFDVVLQTNVDRAHKLAVRPIAAGELVLKYGEVIGQATEAIPAGAHVHVHNVTGIRGRRAPA